MTERPEAAPDTIYARIEALEKRVEALEIQIGVGRKCVFETRIEGTPGPYTHSWSRAFCTVHQSYECGSPWRALRLKDD